MILLPADQKPHTLSMANTTLSFCNALTEMTKYHNAHPESHL